MACDPALTNAVLTFASGNFPEGYCPASYQSFANDLAAALSGYLPGNFTSWNIGSTTPTPENRDKPWLLLDAATCRPLRVYYWSGDGAWVSPHPDFAGKVVMYEGLEADVPTLDGGAVGVVTPISGPMWEIITAMAGKSPIGPGTLPDTTAIAVGGVAGGAATLTINQIPSHKHLEIGEFTPNQDCYNAANGTETVAGSGKGVDGTAGNHSDRIQGYTSNAGGGLPVSILSPVRGIWFIRKTARTHYAL